MFFLTLLSLGAQIRVAQTLNTVVNFGLYQPLTFVNVAKVKCDIKFSYIVKRIT